MATRSGYAGCRRHEGDTSTEINTIREPDLASDEFKAAGVDEIALRVHDDAAFGIKTIGEKVIPTLR